MCRMRANQKFDSAVSIRALAGNRRRQNDVEGRQPVGRDDQQMTIIDGVDVADLAARDERQRRQVRLEQRLGHGSP